MEVVGVVKDARFGGPRNEYRALVFVAIAQQSSPVTGISIRTSGGRDLSREIRGILAQTAPGIGLARSRPTWR
jgi:hypothetical protein